MRKPSGITIGLSALGLGVFLGLLFSGSGCSIPEGIEPGKLYLLGVKGPWTPDEIAQLQAACADWGVWTKGELLARLAVQGEEPDGYFVNGQTGTKFINRLDGANRALVINLAVLYERGFGLPMVQAQAADLLGKAAGMKLHDGPQGVLSKNLVTTDFTPDDIASCKAAGFCTRL